MSQTVFLHVGLPKSGTTYIQRVLATHKEALASNEQLLFPGRSWGLQVNATRDVRQMSRGGEQAAGSWKRLVNEVHAWPGDAVVSMEWLCAADAEQVERIVGDLRPSRVKVVFTVRDIARTLPSAWQETVKNRKTWTWSEFLAGVTAEDPRDNDAGNRFWPKQDMAAMLDTWGSQVSREDLVVVTVPPAGSPSELLWERFADVLGIPARDYGTALPRHNESLGVESTEVVRRLNEVSRGAGFGKETHTRLFKHVVARGILAARRSQESRLALPPEQHDWARDTSASRSRSSPSGRSPWWATSRTCRPRSCRGTSPTPPSWIRAPPGRQPRRHRRPAPGAARAGAEARRPRALPGAADREGGAQPGDGRDAALFVSTRSAPR